MNNLDKAIKSGAAPLLGIAIHRYDPAVLEMAALAGFKVAWFEMEHMAITFREACDLCRLGSALGVVTLIRVPNANRENVLRAAECGPDIIDIPMGNSLDVMEELVRHARYAPDGDRGFFSVSRAARYGLRGTVREEQLRINSELCLMSQIETRHAVEEAETLCAAKGIDAIFLGPGDLSASFGVPGQTTHALVEQAVDSVIQIARRNHRKVAIVGAAADAAAWARRGVDILFCTSDTACIKAGLQGTIDAAKRSISAGPASLAKS